MPPAPGYDKHLNRGGGRGRGGAKMLSLNSKWRQQKTLKRTVLTLCVRCATLNGLSRSIGATAPTRTLEKTPGQHKTGAGTKWHKENGQPDRCKHNQQHEQQEQHERRCEFVHQQMCARARVFLNRAKRDERSRGNGRRPKTGHPPCKRYREPERNTS